MRLRSISSKLILAFLSIGILSVASIFVTARWNTRAEFIRFLTDQNQNDLVEVLASYHLQNGSWEGVEIIVYQQNNSPGPGMGPERNRGPMSRPFILTDQNGQVIFSNFRNLPPGAKISTADLETGTPISEDRRVIGILISPQMPYEGQPRELEFIERINLILIYGALIGGVIALLLGVFLSRTLTRPIRELTRATHAISEGDLAQQVPVRTNDELGELAQAFNKMSNELSRSVNTRKQMTADIAHELRTPLSLILGHAEAVHDGVLPPTRENFEIIREEATRLEHLVNDLRTLTLADAGELSINRQIIEPQRLIREVAALYQYQTERKNITLELDVDTGLPNIEVDPGRMTQVLTNILDNAMRHTPEGGHILLAAKQAGESVELVVQDSGPGVSVENLERIFERFYRTDASRQREGIVPGGSGLGLAIARSIVQAHNGQLSAESDIVPEGGAGKGLKIIITLPKS